ncbi:MAG: type 2 isopentenyl-diphosphate Delta-isomerase, partial [Chloroflexota bacterium]
TILAQVAQQAGIALGLGSGRVLLEQPEVRPTFHVRPHAPDVPIFANLGAVQLNQGIAVKDCRRLVDLIEADALVLHLNALQEALQPEGDTEFAGLLEKIGRLCDELDVPVIVKEVGWGIAPDVVVALLEAGVAAVDVAGAGGTSWSEVERHRLHGTVAQRVAAAFSGWGLPTAEAIRGARRAAPDAIIFASGGIRTGMEAAKALGLGANLVGAAGPFLRAAAEGREAALELAAEFIETLRTVMFCIGARDLTALRETTRLAPINKPDLVAGSGIIHVASSGQGDFIDITDQVAELAAQTGIQHGLVQVCSQHTTAAIRVNENEPLLLADFRRMLERLAPEGEYEHDDLDRRVGISAAEPRNGHAHCRHLLLSSSESVALAGGRLRLGQYQRIFLIELDSPRQRQVSVQVVGT